MNQIEMYDLFSEFLIERNDDIYPPYHKGDYLEEFFVKKFKEISPKINALFIPVHWTAVFNYKVKEGLGPQTENWKLRNKLFNKLSLLPENMQYFTVSTHDDAPQGKFPLNTRHFYAGGNSNIGTDPIPLICSELNFKLNPQKTVFCSFVGSTTNNIRNQALQQLYKKEGYLINAFHWNASVPENQLNLFLSCTSKSIFTLCPRGYGATSYRLYESMKLGSIPVYLSDKHLLPWSDELDWQDFCIVVNEMENYDQLDDLLKGITETTVQKMQDKIKEIYPLYFTIPAVYNQIIKRIK